jgi:hypothetical protein
MTLNLKWYLQYTGRFEVKAINLKSLGACTYVYVIYLQKLDFYLAGKLRRSQYKDKPINVKKMAAVY